MSKGMVFRRMLCAAAVIGASVLIGYHGGAGAYTLFWASLLIPLFSFLYSRVIASKLRISFRVGEHTVLRGDHTTGTLILVNESAFPIPAIRIRLTSGKITFSDAADEVSCSLKPGEALRLEFDLACGHCGGGYVGAESIYVRDIFALSEASFSATERIDVLPRTRHISDLIIVPVREIERRSTARSYFGDTMPDGQLKPYVPGEDVRRIHWKASVLQGKPIMRNLTPEPKNEIVLLPDARASLPAGTAGWMAEDSVIEGALVIADYFLRHSIALRVVPDTYRAVSISTPSNYLKLYDICSSDYFSGTERPDELMHRDISEKRGIRSYILLTWELDESFIRRVSQCIDVGAEVSVVFIGDSPEAKSLALVERRMGFYQVTQQNDIFSVLGGTAEGSGGVSV